MHLARTHLLLALTASASILLAGCSPAPTPTPAPAAGEPVSDGTFTLYSGRSETLVQPLVDLFEQQTGITVDVRYGNTAELGALLLEEGERTPAHAFLSQDAGALGALANANLFVTLPAEITDRVPAGFTSTDGSWVGVTGRARVIVYDGDEFTADQMPSSVDAFTDPEWSGRLGIAPTNASFQSFVTAYRVLKGETAADEWLAAIVANDPQLFENNGAILTAVNEGVVDAGLINHYYWFRQSAETGASNMRAKLAYPEAGDAGSIVNVTGAGLLSAGATDADALEFIEFLVSDAAQTYFVEQTFEYPLVEGIPAPPGLPALKGLLNPELDLADLQTLEATQALLAKHGLI